MRSLCVLASFLLFACSASGSKTPSGLGGNDAGTKDADEGESGISFDAPQEDVSAKPTRCSGDLHSVTDDMGAVQKVCPPDQGCFDGACIPACEAAGKSKGNVGCDFVAATPSFESEIAPPCFAVFLANNWSKDAKITVSRGGTTYDVTTFARIPDGGTDAKTWPAVPASGIPQGKVAVLFLSSDPTSKNGDISLACPVPTAISAGTAVLGSGKGTAFSVKTDAPVSAYDILPYGGANSFLPSAELLLPTTAWGTNYVSVLPPKQGSKGGPFWGQVVAAEDGTTVQINPTVSLAGGSGAPSAPSGAVTSFTLNAGEFVQWQDSGEMTGSILSSDKPIAFVGGNGYVCLYSTTSIGGGCDSAHQMIPPISALGSEYVAAPYVTRRKTLMPEAIPYRIVGTVDGTVLHYDPPVPGAPTSLEKGTSARFDATTSFVVKSDKDHPFYIGQMMTGAQVSDGSRPGATVEVFGSNFELGDEEFVNVLPPAQFLSKYVFFTDPTYSTTNLVLTRKKTATGTFEDVNVDCIGKVSGWKPVGSSGQYETAEVDLVRAMVGVGSCTNGPHTADSNGPFGLVVWGTDTCASYAYPGGGNVGTINAVVVPPK